LENEDGEEEEEEESFNEAHIVIWPREIAS